MLVAGGALSSRRLAELAGLADGTQARTLVRRLNEIYAGRSAGEGRGGGHDAPGERSAFCVEEVAGGFQLMTRPCCGPWLRRLHAPAAHVRLSTSALETLAVIAYRQPVLRAELEAVRGVQCGEMLRQLGERDLVRIVGRSPELGRPFLYGTTKKFLQVFGLRSLDELPRAVSLRRGNIASPAEAPPEPTLLQVSPTDTPEESAVKIAMLSPSCDVQDELLAFPAGEPLTDRPPVAPRADEDMDDDDDVDDDDDLDDEDDDLDDEDLEDDEWEEVDDEEEEEEDWEEEEEEDEDWDEDEDEDWEEEDEEEGKE